MKLPLAYYGDKVLRQKAKPIETIDESIHQLVRDMEETMKEENGWGLAAPQVHQPIALFITCIPKYNKDDEVVAEAELRVFINPKIISYSNEVWECSEGCLSIPHLRETVIRPYRVTIEAIGLDGKVFTEEFESYQGRGILHENDHLNGVLFIDRLPPKKKKELDQFLRGIKKKYSKH